MIGRLRGQVVHRALPIVVIDVQGVGYEVEVPLGVFEQLSPTGPVVELFTHLVVREDAHALFGFLRETERSVFRQLLKITGVGPRLALAILSVLSPEALGSAITQQDVEPLIKIPGVGKKTAQRLLLELKDKWLYGVDVLVQSVERPAPRIQDEVGSALLTLGYHEKEIRRVVGQLPATGYTLEEGIRLALKSMVREV